MNYIEIIEKIMNEQNGVILSSDLNSYDIPRAYLSMMVQEGQIERAGRAYIYCRIRLRMKCI